MKVDVVTEIDIERPRDEVARFVSDPSNAPRWYANIKSAVTKTPPPLGAGSRMDFVAQFLGRQMEYTYEVTELLPDERMVMRTSQGPFAMETTYEWKDAGQGKTHMTLRNRGEPSGFAGIAAPMMASAMRRENTKDLKRLKELLELRSAD